jgi:3-phenylpropionate/trans-cinnamate dioxygenase ferredoxin subunit
MPRGLGPGEPEGLSLFCPHHFAEFDVRTGEVLGGPAPGPLQTYAARVVDGALEIDVLQ